MLEEYDVVELKSVLTAAPISPGTRGTVLMVFREPRLAYEVEFVLSGGKSLGTYTVEPDQIEKCCQPAAIAEKAA